VHYWWLVKTGNRAPMPFTLMLTLLLLARVVWSLRNRMAKTKRAVAV
jgi:sulfoxide reductase heme-binding subunit YedZ